MESGKPIPLVFRIALLVLALVAASPIVLPRTTFDAPCSRIPSPEAFPELLLPVDEVLPRRSSKTNTDGRPHQRPRSP